MGSCKNENKQTNKNCIKPQAPHKKNSLNRFTIFIPHQLSFPSLTSSTHLSVSSSMPGPVTTNMLVGICPDRVTFDKSRCWKLSDHSTLGLGGTPFSSSAEPNGKILTPKSSISCVTECILPQVKLLLSLT